MTQLITLLPWSQIGASITFIKSGIGCEKNFFPQKWKITGFKTLIPPTVTASFKCKIHLT
jgi:hypothetical protein